MEREREGEIGRSKGKEKERDLPTPHSATPGWARGKPGAWNHLQASDIGDGDRRSWTIFYCLPKCMNRQLNGKYNSRDLNLYWNRRTVLQEAACCSTTKQAPAVQKTKITSTL